MTIGALRFCMTTRKRELRIFVVIEQHTLPAFAGVARIAFVAKRTLVLIIFFVAADATCGSAFEGSRGVTTFARHHGVQPHQRKLCFGVIEYDFIFPAVFVVAFFAALALLTFVHIVESMAADAGIRQRIMHIAAVTGIASDICVFSTQHEFRREIVIEFFLRPGRFVVARIAALAIFTFMNIVSAMTRDTFGF